MADYQGFATNVLRSMQPAPDRTIPNMLLARQIQTQDEDRSLRREENALNRGYRERQLGLAENADKRAAVTSRLDTGEKITKRAIAYATAANSPEAWDANVERLAMELDQTQPGLGDQVRPYKGRYAEKDAIIQSMVSPDTRFSAGEAQRRQDDQQAFTAGQNEMSRASTIRAAEVRSGAGGVPSGYTRPAEGATPPPVVPIPGGPADPKGFSTVREAEAKFRAELKKPIEQAAALNTQMNTIRSAAKQGPGVGDIALITAFNKMIDEGAVVREADVALTKSAQGLMERVQSFMAQAGEGAQLSPKLRADLLNMSETIFRASSDLLASRVMPYKPLVEDQYGDFGRVVPQPLQKAFGWDGSQDAAPAAAPAAPQFPPLPPGFVVVP